MRGVSHLSYRILVVDDEPDIVGAAQMILEGEGYYVVSASNGEEALRKAVAETPDIIFLDIAMPGKSGLDVCRMLKTRTGTAHIPVIMFTAFGASIDRQLADEAGADGYFTKPFTAKALIMEAKNALNLSKERSQRTKNKPYANFLGSNIELN